VKTRVQVVVVVLVIKYLFWYLIFRNAKHFFFSLCSYQLVRHFIGPRWWTEGTAMRSWKEYLFL